MAGAIAHHFNNQLQAVMMNLQLAMDDLPQNLRSVEDLTDAMQSAHKAAEVSTLMLTYLGQTAARREPLDLSEVCQHHLPMLRAAMPQSVSLESRLAAPGPVIDANANQIQQILTNLLTNAWEAADETWGAVHLTVKTIAVEDIPNINRYPIDCQTQGSAYACLKVADEGCGIADKDIEKCSIRSSQPSSQDAAWGWLWFWGLCGHTVASSQCRVAWARELFFGYFCHYRQKPFPRSRSKWRKARKRQAAALCC